MSPERIRYIILGEQRPTSLDMAKIAEVYRVSVDWLLYGTAPRELTIKFCTVNEEEAPDPEEYTDNGCSCPPEDDLWLLEVEEGGIQLRHKTCGRPPMDSWGDWVDLVQMAPVEVRLAWVPDCDGSMWHGMDRCDHGSTIELKQDGPAVE
jgi:hypothetical protein